MCRIYDLSSLRNTPFLRVICGLSSVGHITFNHFQNKTGHNSIACIGVIYLHMHHLYVVESCNIHFQNAGINN